MSLQGKPYAAYAAVYDRTGQSRFSLKMLSYAKTLWDNEWPRSVLDLGCGTGAAAVALALRDVRVVGIDNSPEMLDVARRRAERWGARVTWVLADFRDYSLKRDIAIEGLFDAAICFYDAINYCLTEQDLEAFLRRAALHVRVGGSILFDCISTFGIKHAWGNSTEAKAEADMVRVWQASYDKPSGRGRLDITYLIRDEAQPDCWRRFDEAHVHRGYDPLDIHAALRSTGWEPRKTHVCFHYEPVTLTTYRVAYLAVRRA
jgi:SAM-dependent methyltransferase